MTERLLAVHGRDSGPRRSDLELREVELREATGRWPAGTRGVIVDAFETRATVEIMDEDGRTLELLSMPYTQVALLESPEQEHLVV